MPGQFERDCDILARRHRRQQVKALEHNPDMAPAQPRQPVLVERRQILPGDDNSPGARPLDAGDNHHQARFAGPRRPDQRDRLARHDRQRHAAQNVHRPGGALQRQANIVEQDQRRTRRSDWRNSHAARKLPKQHAIWRKPPAFQRIPRRPKVRYARPRRAVYLCHRRRALGRRARRRADPGLARAYRRGAAGRRHRRRADARGGRRVAGAALRAGRGGSCRGVAARAAPVAPDPRDRRRDPRDAARRGRHDRQFRLLLAGRAPAAPRRREDAADRLCRADGVGLASRPCSPHGALVRPRADPLAVRAALFREGRARRLPCRAPGARKRRRNAATRRGSARRTASPPTRGC